MTTGKNAGKAGNKNNKAANTTAPATPAVETTATATETATEAEGESEASAPASEAPATPAATAPKQKARIPLKGVSRRGGGGGGGKSLGTVYNIAEVMYGHITSKTIKGEKETAVMHHIINGEAIFVKEDGEVMIDFATPGEKLYHFVPNVKNMTDRKTSLYKEVEGDVEVEGMVPVLNGDGTPAMNEDGTPKQEKGIVTVKGPVPAPGCAWHGFIVANPANAQKVYNNIKAMLTNPLTEGSVLRERITLLEPPFNLHSGAAATLSLETAE